ncbi:MAG: TatD family nuclease-associated radical SAM protein [Thermoleophilia bacterium]
MPDTIVYRGKGNIYLNITNRCSCDCDFCFRSFTTDVFGSDLALSAEPTPDELTREIELAFIDGPADEVAFVGMGEPTMRLDVVLAVTEWLTTRRLPSRLVTNGHGRLLNPEIDVVASLARVGLGAVTVSLNAADPQTYDLLCRPVFSKAFREVILFAQACVQAGIATTLTAVDLPESDPDGCRAIAEAVGASFRLRAHVPPPAHLDAP